MIVRNFLQQPAVMQNAHRGQGEIRNVFLYGAEDFTTPLRFVIYSEIQPGDSIGYHTHGENEEVYVVLEGEGTMTVNGECRKVTQGDVLLNRRGWSHGLVNDSNAVLKLLVFEVDGSTQERG